MGTTEFRVRMPPALHEQLKARAAQQGVSLNQLCVALLAGGVGFNMVDATNAELEATLEQAGKGSVTHK